MKRYAVLMIFLLAGCSSWSFPSLSLDMLNPWAYDKNDVKVENLSESESQQPEKVNTYLWSASVEKLAFMGFDKKDAEYGVLDTAWKSPRSEANERYKIAIKIKSNEFRADALDMKIYKEIKSKTGWKKATASHAFYVGVEQQIINRAKVLYINEKNEDF